MPALDDDPYSPYDERAAATQAVDQLLAEQRARQAVAAGERIPLAAPPAPPPPTSPDLPDHAQARSAL